MAVIGSVSVRVVPSFSGMNKAMARQFGGSGRAAAKRFSKQFGGAVNLESIGRSLSSVGKRATDVGSSLTRNVTRPAGIAAAAIGGIPAALGFGRLISIDTARAKLAGLGYDAEEVKSISNQVTEAIEGTMVTMAEGTDIAAGALAAGVKQGDDLKSFIKLVGDAAAASGRPINEMAMIFNRVQGSGKLMTQELNMLEDAVPGATATLAESYGVSYEAFREMVTNGEVDAKHFRKVMDEFMGGMGEEYSKSFAGMAKNVVAYLGIIGESLMGGVFQQSKDELRNFIDLLKSEQAQTWAKNAGKAIGDAFTDIVAAVKSGIKWWNGLNDTQKKLVGGLAGVAVAAGPVLGVLGIMARVLGPVITGIGLLWGAIQRGVGFIKHFRKLAARFGELRVLAGYAARAFGVFKGAIGVLTGPIGWITTALLLMWKHSEDLRNAVVNLGRALWDSLVKVWDALKPAFSGGGASLSWLGDIIGWVAGILGDSLGWVINKIVVPAIGLLASGLVKLIGWARSAGAVVKEIFGVLFTGDFKGGSALQEDSPVIDFFFRLRETAQSVFSWFMGTAVPWMKRVWDGIVSGARWMWENVLRPAFNGLKAAWSATVTAVQWAWANVLKPTWDALVSAAQWMWQSVLKPAFNGLRVAWQAAVSGIQWAWENILKPVWDGLVSVVMWLWRNVAVPAFAAVRAAWDAMVAGLQWAWNTILKPVVDAVAAVIGWLWNNIAKPYFGFIWGAWQTMATVIMWIWNNVLKQIFILLGDIVVWLWKKVVAKALPWIKNAWSNMVDGISGLWNNILKPLFLGVAAVVLWLWKNAAKRAFEFIRGAWQNMVKAVKWAWENILKPAIDAAGRILRWLWENVAKPAFGFIKRGWRALVDGVKFYWRTVLKPAIDAVARIFRWLWNNVAKPVFNWIKRAWRVMVEGVKLYWNRVLKPIIEAVARVFKWLYKNAVRPALDWISDKWSWLAGKVSDFWEDKLKPALKAFGGFVKNDVPDMVRDGVDMIDKAWRSVANLFRKPINWVINTVWNGGIKKAFDGVAKAVDSDARLGEIPNIPKFAVGGPVRGPGTGTSDDILAKLSNGEHVLTAKEVKALGGHEKVVELRKRVAAGEDITQSDSKQLAGARASDAMLPMGGLWETVKAAGSKALSWGRGLLADTAEKLMSPILDGVSSFVSDFGLMGDLGSGLIDWGWDKVLGWIRGEDKKQMSAPGSGSGLFDGPTGAWRRPSSGPATSWYGPRWGSFHSGVDIAGGGPTYAAYNGAVQRVGWNVLPGRTGLGILLSHGGGLQSYYGHNPVGGPQVSQGQKVKAGQHIGYQGATGNVTGTHLHWELLRNGQAQNVNSMFRDKGGLLYPGMNMVENATGKNEFIFNQRQFDNLNKLAEQGGNGRGDTFIQNVNNNGSPYQDGHDFKMHVRKASRKAGV